MKYNDYNWNMYYHKNKRYIDEMDICFKKMKIKEDNPFIKWMCRLDPRRYTTPSLPTQRRQNRGYRSRF